MLREVLATHSAKLDRIAVAGKANRGFDVAEAARMDLRVGWASVATTLTLSGVIEALPNT